MNETGRVNTPPSSTRDRACLPRVPLGSLVGASRYGHTVTALLCLLIWSVSPGQTLAQPEPQTRVYRAAPHQAQWHAFEGRSGCHLAHEISGIGTALISYRHTDGRHFLSFFTLTPPRTQSEGDLYISEPSWRSDRRNHIERLMVHPHQRTLRFSNRTTNRLIGALHRGLEPQFTYPSSFSNQQVKVALTPAAFQNAHRHFIECIDRYERVDAGTATRGRVIPGRTGEALADSEGGAWEGSLPRLPRGPEENVYFATESSDLTRDAIDAIRQFVRKLEGNPHWGIVIVTGYADTRGSPRANEELARQRATRVRNELERLGIPEQRINIKARLLGTGGEKEEGAYELANNRRVELRTAL